MNSENGVLTLSSISLKKSLPAHQTKTIVIGVGKIST